jgi:DNA mismatch endonuclease (patch repair protein)
VRDETVTAGQDASWPDVVRRFVMTDIISPEQRSTLMKSVRTRGTRPELAVRSALHRAGFRFRVNRRDLPGSPDVILPKWRVALFVHGCFWHSCPHCDRGRRRPKANADAWATKLAQNTERDRRMAARLEALGWRVETVWQCQTTAPERLTRTLRCLVTGTADASGVIHPATLPGEAATA